ncbi:MAG: 50S ribosomal protein L10 [Deltaproteobacteria bacterium]|nr:50S ribosomal protein L10 [Deltaproteobacteria bacterium]
MLKKEEKKALVKAYHDKFNRAQAAFLADYKGIKVPDMTELRRSLRDAGVELRVMKNTLAAIAAKDTQVETLSGQMTGPVAVALGYGDAALAAKKLMQLSDNVPAFKIRAGVLGGKVLGMHDIKGLAALPGREVLVGMLLGAMKNVPASLVCVLSGVPRKLVYALNGIKNAKEGAAG